MKVKDNTYIVIYFITGIFLYGAGFSSIFRLCKNSSYIVIIIGTIIGAIFIPLYKKIINHNNNFIKVINLLFILLINMMILRIFTTSFYLTKTPGLLITIPFITLCFYNSNKGINMIIKETSILFIFSIITIILNLLASTKTGSIYFFIPFNSNNIILGIIYYVVYIISPFIVLNKADIELKTIRKSFILTNLLLLFITLIITYVLGPNLMSMYRFPEYMIFKEINLFGFIENVENLVGLIHFLNLFITSSLCINNIDNIVKNKYLTILLLAIIIFITELVSDKYKYSLLIYKYLPFILIAFIILHLFSYILKKE